MTTSLGWLAFHRPGWLWVAIPVLLLVGAWQLRQARRGLLPQPLRSWAAAGKWLAISLLAMSLAEPVWERTTVRPRSNQFAVVVDNSQSMTLTDPNTQGHRGSELHRLLQQKPSRWQERLEQDFDVRRYRLDQIARYVSHFGNLDFSADQSALGAALRSFRQRWNGRPVAGVLLFTDGIATDSWTEADLAGLPPIYPVVIGQPGSSADWSVGDVSVTTTAFEDTPVTILANVSAAGVSASLAEARLYDEAGTLLQTESVPLVDGKGTVRFQLAAAPAGVQFYRVEVVPAGNGPSHERPHAGVSSKPTGSPDLRAALPDDAASAATGRTNQAAKATAGGKASLSQPAGQEGTARGSTANPQTIPQHSEIANGHPVDANPHNNSRTVTVERGTGPYRILYVSGRPNWEYKFLARSVEGDDQIKLTGLIRIAKQESRFDFRGREGEQTNALFRGFDHAVDTAEQYDQPVLIRLNTTSAAELADGFPTQARELFEYSALIVDDLESAFFTADQLNLIERFVTVRGGSLLMLGGQESFRQGGYERSALGRMLPVYLDQVTPSAAVQFYRWQLTREGLLQPWARLRKTEPEEQTRLAASAPLQTLNHISGIKPGAEIVAEVIDNTSRAFPALVTQRYGQGRCAALLVGDLWRWQLPIPDEQRKSSDLSRTWRQLLRWLVVDTPSRVEITRTPPTAEGDGDEQLRISVKDSEFLPLDAAVVRGRIAGPNNRSVEIVAEPSLEAPGVFTAITPSRPDGPWRVSVDVQDPSGKPSISQSTGWTVEHLQREFASREPNVTALQQIATATGGELVRLNQLDEFVSGLVRRPMPVTERQITPLWHSPWWWALIAGGCLLDWGLRRRRGLS
jgi:uncharacterized membrane protein